VGRLCKLLPATLSARRASCVPFVVFCSLMSDMGHHPATLSGRSVFKHPVDARPADAEWTTHASTSSFRARQTLIRETPKAAAIFA
jgi:hypothetical protein